MNRRRFYSQEAYRHGAVRQVGGKRQPRLASTDHRCRTALRKEPPLTSQGGLNIRDEYDFAKRKEQGNAERSEHGRAHSGIRQDSVSPRAFYGPVSRFSPPRPGIWYLRLANWPHSSPSPPQHTHMILFDCYYLLEKITRPHCKAIPTRPKKMRQ